MIDVNVFLGAYPWRRIPGTSPDAVLRAMDAVGVTTAWATHLPSLFWKDPGEGNPWLYELAAREPRFRPVPVIHPGLPHWEDDLQEAADRRAVAVRADPGPLALAPVGGEMLRFLGAAAEAGLPMQAAVRLEDGRGRHPLDVAPELAPWMVRAWVRAHPRLRLVITHAERSFIEEVHWGSTPAEAARIWWDISWVWGPPEEHLGVLLATMGPARFLLGSGQPLRLAETPGARLDLLDLAPDTRAAITRDTARSLDPHAPEPR